jgi:hypothetical protein
MKKTALLIPVFFAVITGCRKTPDFDQLSYEFIVSTSLDKTADFAAYKTFFISDTVVYVGGIGSDSVIVGPDAQALTKVVKDNLTAGGYTLVPRSAHPDLGLIMTAIKDLNVVIDYYPGWWDPYYGGCYWYYWCYGYYYPWTSVYTYTTGTVILNMYDLKNAPSHEQIKAIWNITALGALGSGSSTNIALGVNALEQGFKQSPYLKTN